MSSYGFGLGIVSIMILFGIIVSGSFTEATNNPDNVQAYIDYNILPPNFDNLLEDLDVNITRQIDDSFADNNNLSPGIKKVIHYMTKGIVYGIYTDVYMGQAINEYAPGLYAWIKENMLLVLALILILMYPDVVSLVIICIFALILIIKERWFYRKGIPKNTWRDFKPTQNEVKKESIFKRMFGRKDKQ